MTEGGEPTGTEPLRAVPVRHPGRWAAVVVIGVLVAMLVHSLASSTITRNRRTAPRYNWHVVGQYLFDHRVLRGVVVTIELTALAMAIGIVLGVILAVMRLSPNPIVASSAWSYVWFFRGTPVLVQILAWNFISVIYPTVSFGVPFGPHFIDINATNTITPFLAGMLALGLNEAAYMSEIVRAGILSVDEGQTEAAQALGMTRMLTLRRIVLPQAMRIIIPPTGNETISMLKTSSLVSVIAVVDLLYAVQLIYSVNFQQIPLLLVAVIWYLFMTSVLTVGQFYLERHYARGSVRELPTPLLQRLIRNVLSFRRATVIVLTGRENSR